VTSHIHVLRPLGPTDPPRISYSSCSRQTCRPASPLGHLSGLKPLSRGLSRTLRYRQRITIALQNRAAMGCHEGPEEYWPEEGR